MKTSESWEIGEWYNPTEIINNHLSHGHTISSMYNQSSLEILRRNEEKKMGSSRGICLPQNKLPTHAAHGFIGLTPLCGGSWLHRPYPAVWMCYNASHGFIVPTLLCGYAVMWLMASLPLPNSVDVLSCGWWLHRPYPTMWMCYHVPSIILTELGTEWLLPFFVYMCSHRDYTANFVSMINVDKPI